MRVLVDVLWWLDFEKNGEHTFLIPSTQRDSLPMGYLIDKN